MPQIKIYCSWLDPGKPINEIEGSVDVELYIDDTPTTPIPPGTIRIIAILEPFDYLKNRMIQYLNDYKDFYNYVFTYHQDILDQFDNAVLSVTPTTWVSERTSENKEFSVSSVFGNKHKSRSLPRLDGYLLRWDLFCSRDRILMNKKFYLSTRSPIKELDYSQHLVLDGDKNPMFDSQFHIAIENTNMIKNAFSEKLIDCFMTRTIPIYYGPDNISDFFNPDGIFQVRSVDDIIDVCNNITEDTYNSKLKYMEENYKIAKEYYSSFDNSMIRKIKELIKNIKYNMEKDVFYEETSDIFKREVDRWFSDKGDVYRRLDYPELNDRSLVFDLGGYIGNFTESIYARYNCNVFVFEPVKKHYDICNYKFSLNDKIKVYNFGLSGESINTHINVCGDISTIFNNAEEDSISEDISLVCFSDFVKNNNIESIDLLKINIEGGEYELLLNIIKDSDLMKKIKNIQVQYHIFVENHEDLRSEIELHLKETHTRNWNYDWVWENWKIK